MLKRKIILSLAALALLAAPSLAQTDKSKEVKFTVRIENISSADGQTASNGTRWPFALSPGLWVTHEREVRLFREGHPAVNGLEPQAEHGDPSELVRVLESRGHEGMRHGVFNTPVGASGGGPIGPGGGYEFSFSAKPGMRLSVVTMFGQSTDWFSAPKRQGIDACGNGKPLGGDITNECMLFDARTEKDEERGRGPSQGPRQKDPDAGEPENSKVHAAKSSAFLTRNAELFKVTITSQ